MIVIKRKESDPLPVALFAAEPLYLKVRVDVRHHLTLPIFCLLKFAV